MAKRVSDKEQACRLLKRYGHSSLDYYKLWDKRYVQLEPEAIAAYGSSRGAIVVLENPIGERKLLSRHIDEVIRYAQKEHESLAFLEIGTAESELYRQKNFTVIKIGEIARVAIKNFLQFYLHDRNFRYKRNHCERQNYHLRVLDPPLSDNQYDELRHIHNDWLSRRNRHEQGFATGYFESTYIRNTRIFTLCDESRNVIAFTTETPSYRKGELIIDVVSYLAGLANGAIEYLVMEVIKLADREGYEYINLGMTPMAGIDSKHASNNYEKLMAFYFRHFTWPLGVRGLRDFKAQFQPEWESCYIACYGHFWDFARIGLGAVTLMHVKSEQHTDNEG